MFEPVGLVIVLVPVLEAVYIRREKPYSGGKLFVYPERSMYRDFCLLNGARFRLSFLSVGRKSASRLGKELLQLMFRDA